MILSYIKINCTTLHGSFCNVMRVKSDIVDNLISKIHRNVKQNDQSYAKTTYELTGNPIMLLTKMQMQIMRIEAMRRIEAAESSSSTTRFQHTIQLVSYCYCYESM